MSRRILLQLSAAIVVVFTIRGCGTAFPPIPGSGLPNLVTAKALSNHYVEVTYSEMPGEEGEDPGAYLITESDGTVLPVEAAIVSKEATKIILTTGPQKEVEYQLSVNDRAGAGRAKDEGGGSNMVTFAGSAVSEPFLARAISLGSTSVLLTFSAQMDNTVEVVEFYRISAPDL